MNHWVEYVRIRYVPIVNSKKTRKGAIMLNKINEKASSVHAYVVFVIEQSAEASLALNISLIDGNHIRCDRACPPRNKLKGQEAPLYDSKRTVFMGNLPFDVKEAANLVIKKGYLKLRQRELRIFRFLADATPSKRKSNSSEAYSPAQKRHQKDKVVTPTATTGKRE